jgi:hypothetical protein
MFDLTPVAILIALLVLDVLALRFGSDSRTFDWCERPQPSP